ncbi:MAG: O-antigen ligase family protein [Bacteroidales bacterium]|nr:O-antigen ligase family protein [Bacteroidales bacterium]
MVKNKIFNLIVVKILVCFFILMQLFPPLWIQDITSLRHFFIALFDICSIGFILFWIIKNETFSLNKHYYYNNPLRFISIKIWLVLLLFMLVSFFWAMNVVESVAIFNRWAIVFLSSFVLIILCSNNDKIFRNLVYCTIVASFINVLVCIFSYYYFDVYISQRNNLMLNGGYGNKNIFAVCLLFKLPLLYYAVLRYKKIAKYISLSLIFLITFCLIIISTRSSFIGLALQMMILLAYLFVSYFRFHRDKKYLIKIALVIVVALFGFFIGNKFIEFNYKHYAVKNVKNLYTVSQRVKTIEEGNSKGRLLIWKNTIKTIKQKPIIGHGIGNHKLAIMKVEAQQKKDFVVSDHAHNDYLEIASELGIVGLAIYLLFYFSLIITAISLCMDKKLKEHYRLVSLSGLLLLITYMNDAMFNFPLERASCQIYLALSCALIAYVYLRKKKGETNKNIKTGVIISIGVMSIFMFYIETLHLKSSIMQRERIECHNNGNINHISPEYWVKHTPWIPNIDESDKPLAINNAMMFAMEDDYRQAIDLILSDNSNPYYGLKESRLATYYNHLDMLDSSLYYAEKCIKMKPLCYYPVRVKVNIYGRIGRRDKQIEFIDNYLSKQKKEPMAWIDQMNVYIKLKQYKKAYQVYKNALKNNPHSTEILSKKVEIDSLMAEKEIKEMEK